MIDVAHLFNLFAQYGETSRDLLFRVRPRRFSQIIRTAPNAYLKPFQFLVISLFSSAVFAFTTAALILVGPERETVFHIGVLGCLAIVVFVWLENLFVIAAAKLAAFILGVSASVNDLFEGYCYASIAFPVFIVATEILFFVPEQQFTPWVLVAYVGQLLFLGVASITMISFVAMHPRYTWRAIVGTHLLIFTCSYTLVLVLGYAITNSYSVHPLEPFEHLESALQGQRTSTGKHCDRATITGTVRPNGEETTAWFEWGDTPALNNVTVTQRFVTTSEMSQALAGLKPNTPYYYRLVGSNAYGSFKGRIHSFRTPQCPR